MGTTLDQNPRAVPNECSNGGDWMSLQACFVQRVVQRVGDSFKRIDERSIEIKDQTLFHTKTLPMLDRLWKRGPLKSDQADQFGIAEIIQLVHGGDQCLGLRDVLDGYRFWRIKHGDGAARVG